MRARIKPCPDEVLFIENKHAHKHIPMCTHVDKHTHTPLVILKLGQCEPSEALLRWKESRERWLQRVKVGRFRGQIHLCSHISAQHSGGYGAWLHTAASIMFVQAFMACKTYWGNDTKRRPVSLMYNLKVCVSFKSEYLCEVNRTGYEGKRSVLHFGVWLEAKLWWCCLCPWCWSIQQLLL